MSSGLGEKLINTAECGVSLAPDTPHHDRPLQNISRREDKNGR